VLAPFDRKDCEQHPEIVIGNTFSTAAVWSYGLTALGYLAFALWVGLRWRESAGAFWLLTATIGTGLWATLCMAAGANLWPGAVPAASAADTFRYAAWFVFVGSLIRPARLPRVFVWLATAVLAASLLLAKGSPLAAMVGVDDPDFESAIRLGAAVIGLALVEQLMRRVHAQARWSVKPLCIALAGVFGWDLFLYADALLFGQPDANIWLARGVINVLVIPLIAISTARNTGWTSDMHVSRAAAFHTAALVVSGIAVLAIAAAGYFVRYVGGDLGRALQIEFVFAAVVLMVIIATSGRARSTLRVFLSKHFFSYRYDYREEWLRFTEVLSKVDTVRSVQERVIEGLANLVESPAGMLWLEEEGGGFRATARWNMPAVEVTEPAGGSLPRFLARTRWVIGLDEYAAKPRHYPDLALPAWLTAMPGAWLVVPLMSGGDLLGFVVLATPRASINVDWEVRDLLKTASRQAASYLGQMRASEALLEARKFEAFNRMSAFVVHDLKNLVTQLSLLLRNAERHRDNPAFQRDMYTTVGHVVDRMNGLLMQLRAGATPVERPGSVALGPVVRRACAAATGRASIALEVAAEVSAVGHEDRLEHVIGHLIQNALDATDRGGNVSVRVGREEAFAFVEIRDTGVGMTSEFVRDRLFKPFETTKASGMGIGVYECSKYVSGLGGRIVVESALGAGTRVRVLLPHDGNVMATAGSAQEVA
jgi:putative PEP-CTERM system histidine kinase